MKLPTFYHFQYFCRLLFEGCRNFSSCYGLTFDNINQSFDAQSKTQLGLATLRSEFFKIILKNCREFIGR